MNRRRNSGRNVNGILLLDKPAAITSNAALQEAKRLFDAKKAGHTGSLDPLATGLLPLCFGEATKMSAFLLEADKRYQVTIKLGVSTSTGDAEGKVLERCPVGELTEAKILSTLALFHGVIEQIPPMYSAIKKNGQPLYKLARQGIEVERTPRNVSIHELILHSFSEDELEIEVFCSKGTYIRTLAEDIGERLGCKGYVLALRRTQVGEFQIENATTLAFLRELKQGGFATLDARLQPIESALTQWPGIMVSNELAFFLSRGQPVMLPLAPRQGWVKLYRGDKRFMGVGCVLDDGRVSPKRLVRL